MTTISIRLWATFPDLPHTLPHGRNFDLQVAEGTTVLQLVGTLLGIDTEHVSVVAVNGTVAAQETVLQERDHVDLFRPLAGG